MIIVTGANGKLRRAVAERLLDRVPADIEKDVSLVVDAGSEHIEKVEREER